MILDKKIIIPYNDFIMLLNCISKDNTKYTLNGIYIDENNCVSVDGLKMYIYNHSKNNNYNYSNDGKILSFEGIKKSNFKKFDHAIIELFKTYATIKTNNNTFSKQVNYLNGNFPNYFMFIPKINDNSFYIENINSKEFIKSIKTIKNSINRENNKIIFYTDNDNLIIDSIKNKSSLKIFSNFKNNAIGINYKFFYNVPFFKNGKIKIQFNDILSPVKIKNDNNKNSKYIIMPMKLSEIEEFHYVRQKVN